MKLKAKQFTKFKQLEKLGDKRDKQQEAAYQKLLKLKEMKDEDTNSTSKKKEGGIPSGNDFNWFNKYPDLMKDAANFLSNWIPGTDLDESNGWGITGVVTTLMIDTYGADYTPTDPINMAARELYLKMFRKYRGISAYQAADLGIVLIAGVEVIKTVAVLERVYGIINRYHKSNWNMPYTELESMGINSAAADYIRDHLSDYRYDLNLLIEKAQRLCVPKDMSILDEKIALYANEYCDYKDSSRAQLLLFMPKVYGQFDETSLSTGSSVVMNVVSVCSNLVGNKSLINYSGTGIFFPYLQDQIDAMVGSDSVQKIFGDLMAWFGEGNMITLQPLPEDYIVLPVYSESILHKFHNCETADQPSAGVPVFAWAVSGHQVSMTATDKAALGTKYWIHQYNNVINTIVSWVWGTTIPSSGAWHTLNAIPGSMEFYGVSTGNGYELPFHFLDSIHSEFTPEVVCEGVLWKKPIEYAIVVDSGTNYYYYVSKYAGLEVVVNIRCCTRRSNGSITITDFYTAVSVSGFNYGVPRMSQFDWAPNYYYGSTTSGGFSTAGIGGEIDRVRQLPALDIGRIQRTAVMSAFKSDLEPMS